MQQLEHHRRRGTDRPRACASSRRQRATCAVARDGEPAGVDAERVGLGRNPFSTASASSKPGGVRMLGARR